MPERVHGVLARLVSRYIEEPWRWPREEDLVGEMVTELGQVIRPGTVPVELGLPPRLIDKSRGPRQSARIRREVKLGTARAEDEGEDAGDAGQDGKQRQRHSDRFDIGVFKETTVQITLAPNGPRDVVLRVRPEDLAALIEVKVYPEHYFQGGGESPWLNDIKKLRALDMPLLACVVVLDTSIPLESAGVTWRRSPRALRANPGLPPWPLKAELFEVDTTIKKRPQRLHFTPDATPARTGTYLFAPALRPASMWRPRLDAAAGCVPLASRQDVVSCCWEVT